MIKTKRRTSNRAAKERWAKLRAENAEKRAAGALKAGVIPAVLYLEEARFYLGGLSVPTMHRLIQRGILRPTRITRRLGFTRDELDRALREGMS